MATVSQIYDYVLGVDTHAKQHAVSLVQAQDGTEVDSGVFPVTPAGYSRCVSWVQKRTGSTLVLVSMEGTGSFGQGLRREFGRASLPVVEAPIPPIRGKRRRPKTDLKDAHRAALAVLAIDEQALLIPRQGHTRSALRVLVAGRQRVTIANTAAINHLTALVRSEDLGVDARKPLSRIQIRTIAGWRARLEAQHLGCIRAEATRIAKDIENNWDYLEANKSQINALVTSLSPALIQMSGIGPITAAQILLAWSHPGRFRNEAAFAALAGTSPIPASSGNHVRYRLNRGGDRNLNKALHTAVVVRMRIDEDTKAYVKRRTEEGKNKREIMRCLKRYLARQIHRTLTTQTQQLHTSEETPNIAA